MAYTLSNRSLEKLEGVKPELVKVVKELREEGFEGEVQIVKEIIK